jgi:hypothetical protein
MTDVENTQPIRELVKEKSVTMEYFLEVSHLDSATAELLKKYDRDGNGSFSKDEVVAIILDLREAVQSNEMLGASNKMFKRMLMVAVLFCVLLLTSMFGLSYAVAALTAKINVDSNGVMTTVDGSAIVKTDSTAFTHTPVKSDTGTYCITAAEAQAMAGKVLSGSSVLVEFEAKNGTQKEVQQLSSSTVTYNDDGSMCFVAENGRTVCMKPASECNSDSVRRRLQFGGEGDNMSIG